MYFVKYGKEYLHDPRIEEYVLIDLSLDCDENTCGYCDFTIYPSHPMYNKLKERDADNPIEVYDDDILLFTGFIYELGTEFYLDGHVKCKGELDYLSESIVRPYSTLENGYGDGHRPPTSVNGYFQWLIEQHNNQVKDNKRFTVGINQGGSLDTNNYLYRESTKYPTTWSEIGEKLLDELGGYLRIRHEGDTRFIDYLSEWTDTNTQILDFGKNLTDYTQTDDSESIATFVIPLGARMSDTEYSYNDGYYKTSDTTFNKDKEYYTKSDSGYTKCSEDLKAFEKGVTYYEYFETFDESGLSLTIVGLEDKEYDTAGYRKSGDIIYCDSAVQKYGWIGVKYENSDITTKEQLVSKSIIALKELISPKRTIEIKAVDMHLVNPDIKPIRIGEYVRVRSKPHNLDSYFLCTSIDLDLNSPENSTYTLGTTFDTLTGQQNKRIKLLNASINQTYEQAEKLTEKEKQNAQSANEAWNKANNAQNTADSKPDMSDVEDYVASRGENLVTNGTCLLGDNTNFSSFTYDGSDTYYAGGSFKISSTSTSGNIAVCDEFIPVDTASKYLFSYWIKTSNASARYYDFIASYDIDKKSIYSANIMWIAGSTTTLAKELKNGDTIIYLTSAAGFDTTTTEYYHKGLIFWNYKNSKGYTYGPETYSRNRWDSLWGDGSAIDKSNNTITLKTAWTHGTFPAGTSVSQCDDGGSYIYLNGDFTLSAANTWIHKTGTVCGVGKNNVSGKFREGTAFVKVGWITNRDVSSGATCWLSTISLTQNVGLADVIKSVDVEYYLSTSATSLSGGSWSTTAPTWVDGKYMWSRTVTVDGIGSKTYSPNQNGVCIAGAKGNTGSTGAAGKGVTSIVEEYYKSTSATSLSGGSWGTTYPGWENGKYIWTRSVITYTDKTTTTTTAVCVTGTKGDTGAKGDKGANGKSIGSVTNYYLATSASSNVTTSTSGWTTTVQSVSASKKYLWNYEVIKYSDGTTAATTTPCIIGAYGDTGSKGDTGATGKGISKVTEHYAVSTSNSTAPTSWSETVPTLTTTNKYLWNYETITYTDNTTADTAKRVIGVYGNTGSAGKGIKSTAVTYQTHSNGTTAPTGTWSTTVPATSADKPYLWTKTVITYTDNTTTTSYAVGSTPEGAIESANSYTDLHLTQTNSELRMDFNKSIASATDDMQSKLDAANNATNQKFGEISKYIRFVDGKIILGETGNELTLTIQNDRVSFQQSGNEVAYFSNNNLYIKRAEVLTTLRIGNYEWTPRNDGGLALRKRGI